MNKLTKNTLRALFLLNGALATHHMIEIPAALAEMEEFTPDEPIETTFAELKLEAETERTGSSSNSSSNSDSYGFGEFILGCIMIPFSLVLLWKNEKKIVTYAKVITEARGECRNVETESPVEDNDYMLVHCTGTTENAEELTD